MGKDLVSHAGLVVGAGANQLYVKLLSVSDSRQCHSCAMSFACKSGAVGNVTVEVSVPEGSYPHAFIGKEVRVEMLPGTTRRATVELLLLPLAVFLVAVSLGTYLAMEAGLTGILALGASALAYFCISHSRAARKPAWRLVERKE